MKVQALIVLLPLAACGGAGLAPPAGAGGAAAPVVDAGPTASGGGPGGERGEGGATAAGGGAGAPGDGSRDAAGASGTGGVAGASGTGGAAGASGVGGVAGASGAAGVAGVGSGGAAGAAPTAASPLTGDVTFSAPSQSFQGSLSVAMSTAVSGAQILYTTDGTLPTPSARVYDGTPLTITATTQLRAQPFASGAPAGAVSTAIYLARTFTLSSAMPIVLLDDYGQGAPKDKTTDIDLAVLIYEPVNGTASLDDLPAVATRAAFHLHGQSSAGFQQKSFKVELRDNADADSKYGVLGMPADADWDFIAPYYDRSLIRNPFVYSLARDMGRPAPRVAFAEVYLGTGNLPIASSDYQGIYWITETLKINGHRLDLNKLNPTDTQPPDVTGGYLVEFNWHATDATKPQIACTPPAGAPAGYACFTDCEVTHPTPLPAPTEQLAYIRQYLQSFNDLLFKTPVGDYGQVIDVGSFVDDVIVNELARNVDAYRRSSYFFKDRNGLLNGGPFWDYNFALGVGNATSICPTPVQRSNGTTDPAWEYKVNSTANSWFSILMSDPPFVDQVQTRWTALRAGLLSADALEQRADALAAQLPADAVARDFDKWSVRSVYGTKTGMTGSVSWVESTGGLAVYGPSATTWPAQVQALKDFVTARAAWLDMQW